MRKLKIICSQQQNHERQRGMFFHALRQTHQAVAPRLERIFPNGAPAIQAILGESHAMAEFMQLVFKDSWPAFFKGKPLACVRNNSPSQRIGIDENVMQANSPEKFANP